MDEKAAACPPQNPNSAAPARADGAVAGNNSKEEGELSCSDDGGINASSAIYRKLPNYIVEHLEFDKELQIIEISMTMTSAERALQLVELAVRQFEFT
ncbi:hypothetical protein MLD38_024160 [Melastoma candidum]|uniref:Uncharacterized protein n=1 Tax=Melastoma candidum TaxID=119954 RepID=A0ACB9NWF2_9MYRT|nr:hypothetical protein MLD38_024160 [Melastoma candidum]